MSAGDLNEAARVVPETLTAASAGRRSRFALSIRERRALLALADLIFGALGALLGYYFVRPVHIPTVPAFEPALYGLAWVLALFLANGYAFQIPSSRVQSAVAVAKAAPLAGLAGVLAFFVDPYVMTRPLIVISTLTGAAALIAMRISLARLLLHESLAVKAVLLADSEPGTDIMETLHAARFECRLVARLVGPVESATDRARILSDLRGCFLGHAADELIVTTNDLRFLPGLVEECLTHGVRVVSATTLVERYMGRVPAETIDTQWYLSLPDNDLWERPYAVLRRFADLALSALISVPFLLVLPVLALLIKLESPGPVFLSQRRVGQHGREFHLLKLRTMRSDAEMAGPQLASKRDPRVTRIGRILRMTRLDEVPQLLNIVRGDMGFIGPRPERPELMATLEATIPHFRTRLLVKPGLTGWAQVKGGYASTLEEMTRKLEYDLYYIKNRSLRLDLQILVNTFTTVVGLAGH